MIAYDRLVLNLKSVGYEVTEKHFGWYHLIKDEKSGNTFTANSIGEIEMFYNGVISGASKS